MKKKLLAMLLTMSCVMQSFNGVVLAKELNTKISEELMNKMDEIEKKEELPVYIWLNLTDMSEVEQKLEDRGYVSVNTQTGEEINGENYQQEKAKIVYETSKGLLEEFVNKNLDDSGDVIIMPGVDIIEAKLTEKEIKKIAENNDVREITYHEKCHAESTSNIALEQIRADWKNGTKSVKYNTGCGYTGYGVKVGIIELNGRYDEKSPQLSSIDGKSLFTINTSGSVSKSSSKSNHATLVTSILVGQAQDSKCSYEGVAPFATVYQMSLENSEANITAAIMEMAMKGVNVINLSAQLDKVYGYGDFDQILDILIYRLGIVFVVAAGNNGAGSGVISSPGKAYNVITVGNVNTKKNATTALASSVFDIAKTSSYFEPSYLSNKPDIAAPGEYISCLLSSGSVYSSYGTSLASPMVAGVVAQMMEANPNLKGNPVAVKAKLLLGANSDKLSGLNNNSLVGNTLQNASGAGMVDALVTVLGATSNNYKMINYDITKTSELCDKTAATCYFNAGDKVRVVMTYDKPNSSIIESASDNNNINLKLISNSSGSVVAHSSDDCNNVEIVEYTVTKSGYYRLVTSAKSFSNKGIDADNHQLHCCVAWRVE